MEVLEQLALERRAPEGARGRRRVARELKAENTVMGCALQLLTETVDAEFARRIDTLVQVIDAVDWEAIRARTPDAPRGSFTIPTVSNSTSGKAFLEPVTPETREYQVSGQNVLDGWLKRRTGPPSRRAVSELDRIRPELLGEPAGLLPAGRRGAVPAEWARAERAELARDWQAPETEGPVWLSSFGALGPAVFDR
ncbi:hypothetical protein ACIQGO_16835 [Streptomyces shenzhenensis]|uniref:hypothetical protein n=1 Tax=Streptomyces shenzhenensis TaxID=943815 RepID=UPI00381CB258